MTNTQWANSVTLLEERAARHLDGAKGAHGAGACGICKDLERQRKALAGRVSGALA